ncbi:peptidoglycan editing factor PgeF [Dokdonella sp.]|uniref:peptidoglycan editing factor PgeF n=1 Tax=Dokdonella sp. TaxID=2291710 RepID=UPI0031C333BF|nr:peptidoglycan editing factor PgeF [Dokdonella sp.]
MRTCGSILVPDWRLPAGVHAALTTRRTPGRSKPPFDDCNLGSRCGDAASDVAANRASVARLLNLPAAPRWLHQVHGVSVAGDCDAGGDEPLADAAVTRRADGVLAILTADCLPVLLCTEDGAAIGAAHAGWRGLAAGVLEATLQHLGAQPDRVLAWLGPAIGAASYEVDEEVRTAFMQADPGATLAFRATRQGHWSCDLALLARRRLRAAGVVHIDGGGFETFSDPRFYSYRRARETGRFASLIWRGSSANPGSASV